MPCRKACLCDYSCTPISLIYWRSEVRRHLITTRYALCCILFEYLMMIRPQSTDKDHLSAAPFHDACTHVPAYCENFTRFLFKYLPPGAVCLVVVGFQHYRQYGAASRRTTSPKLLCVKVRQRFATRKSFASRAAKDNAAWYWANSQRCTPTVKPLSARQFLLSVHQGMPGRFNTNLFKRYLHFKRKIPLLSGLLQNDLRRHFWW